MEELCSHTFYGLREIYLIKMMVGTFLWIYGVIFIDFFVLQRFIFRVLSRLSNKKMSKVLARISQIRTLNTFCCRLMLKAPFVAKKRVKGHPLVIFAKTPHQLLNVNLSCGILIKTLIRYIENQNSNFNQILPIRNFFYNFFRTPKIHNSKSASAFDNIYINR